MAIVVGKQSKRTRTKAPTPPASAPDAAPEASIRPGSYAEQVALKTAEIEAEVAKRQAEAAAEVDARQARWESQRPVYAERGGGTGADLTKSSLFQLMAYASTSLGKLDDSVGVMALECAAQDIEILRLANTSQELEERDPRIDFALCRLNSRLLAMAELERRFRDADGGTK